MNDNRATAPSPCLRTPSLTFRVGTLVYTRAGLTTLFIWLLWGDFCFMLMEQVVPSIVPLQLKGMEAPNWIIGLITTSLPMALTTVISPFVGYRSDRLRTSWGRRIPFLVVTTPFVALFLALMAFSPELSRFVHASFLGWSKISPSAAAIGGIAILLTGYRFFEIVNYLLFGYLLNDVVPKSHLTRFYSLFRIVNLVASAIYNLFLFQHANSHAREIFLFCAALYLVGFLLMCLKVKEGQYPPPPENIDGDKGFLAAARTYFRECFVHRLYGYYFLHTAFWNMGGASAVFTIFLNLSLGLTLAQHGKILAVSQIVTCLVLYPAGVLADRLHPVRVMVWVKAGILVSNVLAMIWIVRTFSPEINFYILAGITAVTLPLTVMYTVSLSPMTMLLLPESRFGQFSSASFMVMAVFGVVSSVAVGGFFDFIRKWLPSEKWGADFCYRFIPVWTFFFFSIGFIFLLLLYREWKRLGGIHGYKPPGFD